MVCTWAKQMQIGFVAPPRPISLRFGGRTSLIPRQAKADAPHSEPQYLHDHPPLMRPVKRQNGS